MFIDAIFVIAKNWMQTKCPSMNKWINDCDLYSGILYCYKKKGQVIHVTIWINLKVIMPSKNSQS